MNWLGKLYKCCSVLKHRLDYVNKDSYYPEANLKSKKEILKDHLWFALRYGATDPFYFTYGFDRKEMTREKMIEEYIIPYSQFQNRINYLNFQNPRYDEFHGKLTGRVITGDKFYFNVFLERFCVPTPRVFCYIKDKRPLYFDSAFSIDTSKPAEAQILSFFSNDMDAFCKPADGQLGNGIFALKIEHGNIYVNNNETDADRLVEKILSADYLIQERIYQHPAMSVFCSSCINSIRLQTVMDQNGEVIPFGAGVRMGREGSTVDNWAKGGVFVGINMDNGHLLKTGFLKPSYGTSVFEHPDTGVKFEGYEIPFYKEAEAMAVQLHKYLYRCHSIGWDIAITPAGPVFIEGNGWWEISLVQAVHGGLKKQIEQFFV